MRGRKCRMHRRIPARSATRGWSQHGEDYIEPHVVGEDGYAYLRLYEMTGNTKYLQAAIRCADALVKNYKAGDAGAFALAGAAVTHATEKPKGAAMGPYSANVIEPIMLFDELIRLGQGDVAGYTRVRAGAWDWFQKYPLTNNVWVGYFEDVPPSMDNMNQVIPLEFARYVLLHPEKDPQWREHAQATDRVGKDHAEMAQVHCARRDRDDRAGRTATSSAATSPINAATATLPGWPRLKRFTSQRPETQLIERRRSARTTGSLIFRACLAMPMLRFGRSGGLPTNLPTARAG